MDVRGVHLQFAGHADAENSGELIDWMQHDLAKVDRARGALLFGGPDFPAPDESTRDESDQGRFWHLIHRGRVAARLTAAHSPSVSYTDSLATWSIPSSGWSYTPRWDVDLISVYPRRVELRRLRSGGQPDQRLVVPNPVAAPRMPTAAADPFGIPTYSEDLARKPELTFVQLSDSQFDDGTVARYERFRHAEQMNELAVQQVNRLQPALAFMTGDLTNKNTPAEWKTFNRIYSKMKPPFYAVPGNHDTLYDRETLNHESLGDLYEPGVENWKLADKLAGGKSADRLALFRHFTGSKPYFTVEKENCVFICLYTGMADVDEEQLQWFRKELERTRAAKHVFVMGHYPLLKEFGGNVQGPEAAEILSLLREYQVAAYLAGHRHRYDYRMHEGTAHILCDDLCWGEYCAYQIYHVFPDRIVACWKPIFRADGNRPLYERVSFPEPRFRPAERN